MARWVLMTLKTCHGNLYMKSKKNEFSKNPKLIFFQVIVREDSKRWSSDKF